MKVCVALDLPSMGDNLALIDRLSDFNLWYKVGFRSYVRDGRNLIESIKKRNSSNKIFLDLKLYDIPNTMADTAQEISRLGIDMFNIHASSGYEAMSKVMERVNQSKIKPPIVLAVTALTSFDNTSFMKIYKDDIATKVDFFAQEAYRAKLNGVVCSAYESLSIKSITNNKFLTLAPGIRPNGSDVGDQVRVMTPHEAKDAKVDFAVIGRPIYKSQTPEVVVSKILEEIV